MQRRCVAGVALSAWALWTALGLTPVAFASGLPEGDAQPLLIPSAGWHGRPIEEPHRHDADNTTVADRPSGRWSAGAVSFGAGFRHPGGSMRVREVQRRLRQLGYRPGPVDGLFGPLTRSSVAWFQVKHGLPVDGRATLETVRHLRARTGGRSGRPSAAARSTSSAKPSRGSSKASVALPQLVGPRSATAGRANAAEESSLSRFAVLAALGLGLLFLGAAAARWSAAVGSRQPEQPALPGETRALAYVLVPAGERQDDRLQAHAAAIESQCAEHRLTLAGIVLDVESARLGRRRPALDAAMTRLIAGEVDFLMVSRFDDPGDTGVARQPLARVAGAGRPIWRDVADRDREASDG